MPMKAKTTILVLTMFTLLCPSWATPPPETRAPLAVLHSGHAMGVSAVAFSADDRLVATGGMDASVRVWETSTGDLLGVFQASGPQIKSIQFGPGLRQIAAQSGNGDGQGLCVWDLNSRRLLFRSYGRYGEMSANLCAFSPTGEYIAILSTNSSAHSLALWSLKTLQSEASVEFDSPDSSVSAMQFDGNGLTLKWSGKPATNAASLAAFRLVHSQSPAAPAKKRTVEITPTGNSFRLLTRETGGTPVGPSTTYPKFTGRGSPQPIVELSTSGQYSLAYHKMDWGLFDEALGGDCDMPLLVTKLASGRSLELRLPLTSPVSSLAVSAAGDRLVVGRHGGVANLWSAEQSRPERDLRSPDHKFLTCETVVDMSRDGNLAGVVLDPHGGGMAGGDGASLWNTKTGKKLVEVPAPPRMAFFPRFNTADQLEVWGFKLCSLLDLKSLKSLRLPSSPKFPSDCKETLSVYDYQHQIAAALSRKKPSDVVLLKGGVPSTISLSYQPREMFFSPSGRHLLARDYQQHASLIDVASNSVLPLGLRTLYAGGLFHGDLNSDEVSFSPSGQMLSVRTGLDEFTLLSPTDGSVRSKIKLNSINTRPVFRADEKIAFLGRSDGGFSVVRVDDGRELATAYRFEKEWLVVSPEGFFDGTPAAWNYFHWRLRDDIFDRLQPEQFFNEFYHPGLLRDVMTRAQTIPEVLAERKDPRASLSIANKDRRLPQLHLEQTAATCNKSRLDLNLTLNVVGPDGDHGQSCGVKDVKVFHNGILAWSSKPGVELAPGPISVSVPIVAGLNKIRAYAFNRDNVKTPDATIHVTGAVSLARTSHAYVLAIGIDHYADPSYNLNYAVADARDLGKALEKNLPFSKKAETVHVTYLLNERATRQGILRALQDIAAKASPEDTVIVTYAGHGMNHKSRFYLLPHDVEIGDDLEKQARRGVSDLDLEAAFHDLQAKHISLILDACHSGQALEAEEWRVGPMNTRGLAQIAWEKGMDILTASQSNQSAKEVSKLGHGLLTYALLEGFSKAPRTGGALSARAWLDFGATEVPQLVGNDREVTAKTARLRSTGRPLLKDNVSIIQTPRVFHANGDAPDWMVSAKKPR